MIYPSISICIPAYNQPDFLDRSLNSIFHQSFTDFEVIVTDDSNPGVLKNVIDKWSSDSRLRYFHNKVRLGSPKNWNYAISHCRGKFIKFMHHDDWFSTETSLQGFYDALHENELCNLAFSGSISCNQNGTPINQHLPTQSQMENLRRDIWRLQFGNIIGAPSSTIYRASEDLYFDESIKWVVDIDFYMQILYKNPNFIYIEEALLCISANSPHQITREIELDKVSGVCEHLYLYSKQKNVSIFQRFYGIKYLYLCMHGCSLEQLYAIERKRKSSFKYIEELVVTNLLKLVTFLSKS